MTIEHPNTLLWQNERKMIISFDAQNTLDKIQHTFIIKTLKTVRVDKKHFKIWKTLYEKPTINIRLSAGIVKTFLLKSGIK